MQTDVLSYLIADALGKLRAKHTAESAALSAAFQDISARLPLLAKRGELHAAYASTRALYAGLGAALTADHWQSPAIDGSAVDEAGDEQGKIVANFNDYKRDQHPIGVAWERRFASAYLSRPLRAFPVVYAVNSGMAALTVASLVVRSRLPPEYRIAVGVHGYFENKELITRMFGTAHVRFFDEDSPETLRDLKPHAVFFDALANDPDMTAPDIHRLLASVTGLGHRVDAVIDVTCLSALRVAIPKAPRGVSVIAFESLNKFHQFGLDRVTGGVVWGYGIPADELYRSRDHAGLGISEASIALLPTPNRRMLSRYLSILSRNTGYAYTRLAVHAKDRGVTVRAPKRDGAFLSVTIPGNDWRAYRRLLADILSRAKGRGVPLVYGTSFGLPVTRIYTWMPRSRYEKTFLRIAPGLETPEEFARVTDVIEDSL